MLRTRTGWALVAGLTWLIGCGGSDDSPGGDTGGTGGSKAGAAGSTAGASGSGAGGTSAGSAGTTGGTAGTNASGSAGANTGGTSAGSSGVGGTTGGTAGAGGAGAAGQSAGGASAGGANAGGANAGGANAGGANAGTAGQSAGGAGESGSSGQAGAGGCQADGDPCDDGGLCAGGECCAKQQACGPVCCGSSDVCSFGKCVTPGASCLDESDCAATDYCERTLGASGSAGQGGAGGGPNCAPPSGAGKCLPRPPLCASNEDPGEPLTCIQACEVKPPTKPFEVELKYYWGQKTAAPFASDVMMTPIVIQLDDDDCDGKVTARDIPEIVFTTFSSGGYNNAGTLHAISIVSGQFVEKWSVPGVIIAAGELAAGNIDGEPGNEVVGCGKDGYMYAFRGDGTQLWKSAEPTPCRMPTIADLDQDGQPEIIEYTRILNGKDGTTKLSYSGGGYVVTSDFDGDGKLEMVSGNTITRADGTKLASIPSPGSWAAVGDLDNDGVPEVITAYPTDHALRIWHLDKDGKPVVVRQAVDLNAPFDPLGCGPLTSYPKGYPGGGPPTVADFNGDGFPDVALAGGIGYAIFDGKKLMDASVADKDVFLWSKKTQDCSSAATGSSIFDFNGDGKAEVLYSDELHFRIYDGPTGDVLFETCNTTGTLIENPIVADVDGDDQADIIVASNAYAFTCNGTKQSGIRVFGSKNHDWVRTRRIWNQHAYHVTNVEEDGTIPKVEQPNWKQPGLNNFRQNKQPGLEFAAPDLVVSLSARCGTPYGLDVTVRNVGQAAVPAGVQVGIYAGQPGNSAQLSLVTSSKTLYPAEAESFFLPVDDTSILAGQTPVYAIADDGTPAHSWIECRTNNNQSAVVHANCKF